MKFTITKTWNWWKFTRLFFAVICLIGGITNRDGILIFASAFLIFQVFFGKCSACYNQSCEINTNTKQ